jgi:outer membrane protein assembly factor BamB
VDNGLVYVANLYTGIYALDSQTGHTKWQHVLGTDAFSNSNGCSWPVVIARIAYANCGNSGAQTQHINAYDATTGTQLWSQASIANPTGVSKGVLYGTSYPGLVFWVSTSDGTPISHHTY